ncbi:MAG TPA: thiolase family protein [Acidimicrobiales bacterium]|nr:thiolase family protein [Acidimicrobiales bacterium]
MVDAVRTPYGRRGGALSVWHPVDLSAEMLSQLVGRAGVDGGAVDDVVLGCTTQVGAQACNIARRAVLAAGWPERVPGATVDRHAASSAQAVHWAAQAVMSGAQGLVVAGGVEVMTAVPLGASLSVPSLGKPFGQRLQDRYKIANGAAGLVPPGLAAEEAARRWSLDRSQLDRWALQSRERAYRAQRKRPSYMLALPGPAKTALAMDEALGRRSSRAEVAALPPVYLEGGVVTAANMAAEGDGASGLLIASADRVAELALSPIARMVSFATVGTDPLVWPAATVPAAREALDRAGLTADDIDWWEVHESSAVAVHVWLAEMKVNPDHVNPTGGALASTAPLGAVGAGLFVAAVSGLVDAGLRRALVCVAAEGGVGTACVLEAA